MLIPRLLLCLLTAAAAHGADPYRVIEVVDGGRIAGTVRLVGELPPLVELAVTKDRDVCGQSHPQEALVVAKSRGLKNAVVTIADIAAGKDFATVSELVIAQQQCVYVPHVQVFRPGSKLTIRNNDDLLHNIHAATAEKTVFNVAQPSYIKKWPIRQLDVDEVVDVRCDVHEWMRAYLVPSHTPYFAVTDASGSFAIGDIPAGQYTLRLWHEALGDTEQQVSVAAGQTVAVNFELALEDAAAAD